MGIGNTNSNKNRVPAEKLLTLLFDDGIYTELLPMAQSVDTPAEAIAACGTVSGQKVYAFAQCEGRCGGAMSVAQAEKLKKLYAMALKTGCPIVGFYMGSSAQITQGNMLMDSLGDLLASSGRLSGVVPQISVVLGDCVASTALLASNADFIVMSEDARLTISADSECKGFSKAAIIAEDAAEAVDKVAELISYLPANNLTCAPVADFADGELFDQDSELKLYEKAGEGAEVSLCRLGGKVVGSIKTLGTELDCKTSKKIASFVRFCDAFSIPVITMVDSCGFGCLNGAKTVLSAYAEATTVKLSVINGKAVGPVYMALAGKGSRSDAVIGMVGSVISPINPEAAAYVVLGDKLTGSVSEQDAQINEYISTELSAENAAQAGYIDDVADNTSIRTKLINYLDILEGKRESSLPKKHSTI